MPLTLHAALIPGWLQVLGASHTLIGKARDWSANGGPGEEELLQARLVEDMHPLSYQFKSCWTHSALAIAGCREGLFQPHMAPPPASYDKLEALLARAIADLEAVTPGELEAIAGNDMVFSIKDRLRLEFTVQDFLLSFSNPNLHFHATTAYDILRMKGLPIGKTDYLGKLSIKAG